MSHSPGNVLKDKGVVRIYHDKHGSPGERVQVSWVQTVALFVRGPSRRFTSYRQSTAPVHRVAFRARGQAAQLVAIVLGVLGGRETSVRRNVQQQSASQLQFFKSAS